MLELKILALKHFHFRLALVSKLLHCFRLKLKEKNIRKWDFWELSINKKKLKIEIKITFIE